MTDLVLVGTRLSARDAQALRDLARERGRSVSDELRAAVSDALAKADLLRRVERMPRQELERLLLGAGVE